MTYKRFCVLMLAAFTSACGGGGNTDFACGNVSGVHVRPSGDDQADGTRDSPLQTLQEAAACSVPTQTIKVAAGTFIVSDDNPLSITGGRWFLGGYATDFSVREPAIHTSIIQAESMWSDTGSQPIFLDTQIGTRATKLDGFTLKGAIQGLAGQAITLTARGGSIISNNVIEGGGNDKMESYALSILGNVTVSQNTVRAGSGLYNRGISAVDDTKQSIVITDNRIEGFAGDTGLALSGSGGLFTISNNHIEGRVDLMPHQLAFERNLVKGITRLVNEAALP